MIEKDFCQIRSTQVLFDQWQKEKFGRGRLATLVKDSIFFRGDFHLIDQFRSELIAIWTS
jgi:hypothetical protein